jgi:membrane protease YdiL (CAAX protease family)
MLVTFLVAAAVLLVLVRVIHPGSLFAFPLRHPLAWAAFLGWYPLLSALPQEIIFRAFFFSRYRSLFGDGRWLVAGSALAFGFAHLAFHNPVAVALTLPAGLMFARTYRRTGTLLFVSLEHALYGCLVFTIGLGPFLTEHPLRMIQ